MTKEETIDAGRYSAVTTKLSKTVSGRHMSITLRNRSSLSVAKMASLLEWIACIRTRIKTAYSASSVVTTQNTPRKDVNGVDM